MRSLFSIGRGLLLMLFMYQGVHLEAQSVQIQGRPVEEYINYLPLDLVFELLKSKYGFQIRYDKAEVSGYRLTYLFTGTRPETVIKICLEKTRLSYLLDENGGFTIYDRQAAESRIRAIEQTRFSGKAEKTDFTLKGIVKDKETGESLPYVNIEIPGTGQGVNTNVDGYFTLLHVPSDTAGLMLSYIGYQTKTFFLKPSLDVNQLLIELEPQSQLIEEIIVTAEREELLRANEKISMLKLSPSKISALPAIGEKDVIRAFQLMPGVSAANENSSGLYVRGGTPDQTLVLYDGFNVYHVEHLFGFFSAFNPNAIKDVQLYKGGFESKFGGRISSVAEITGKDGNSRQFNLGLHAGLLAANATMEIPVGDKITSLFAFRRSYQSGLYQKLFDKYSGNSTSVSPGPNPNNPGGPGGPRFNFTSTVPKSFFYDLNGKINYKPTRDDILSLSIYNGTDDMDNSRTNNLPNFGGSGGRNFNFNVNDQTNWGNSGGSLKWSHRFNQALYFNTLVSYSNYFSTRDRTSNNSIPDSSGGNRTIRTGTLEENDLKDYSAKMDLEWRLNPSQQLEFGLAGTQNDIKYNYAQNDTIAIIDRHTRGLTGTAYLQDRISLKKFNLLPGFRLDYFSPTGKIYLSPRISGTFTFNDLLKVKAAYGHYYQFVKRVIREDILQGSRDFWVLADDSKLPVSKAIHYILGFSLENKNWLFDLEAYHKELSGLSEYSLRIRPSPRSLSYDEKFAAGQGIAKGIDLLIQKKYGQLNGWISYSLGSVKYDFEDYGKTFFANQDVRHELKLVGIYTWKKWDLSATWIYAGGRPYTAPTGGYQLSFPDGSSRDFITVTDKNGLRLPAYHRMDWAATYKWKSSKGAPRSIGLSLFNVYNRTNTWYKEFEIESGQVLETNVNFLGFTPNLSVSWHLH